MSLLKKLRFRLRALTAREELDAELNEELQFHLARQIAQFVEQGMDPAAARTEALRLFGGVEKVKEECRDERRVSLIDNFVQDVGYALRTLGKTKGFAALAILTLALGIGANTAIFSVVNGVLLAPLPYPDGDELMLLQAHAPDAGRPNILFSIPEFYDYRDEVTALDLVEYHGMNFTLLGHGYPSDVTTGVVAHDFFDVLGVDAHLGRTFTTSDEDPEAEKVLVLSHRYWREEFEADPHVVGQIFEMNDYPHRVIGVLPPIPHHPRYNDVYMPTTACPFRAVGEEQIHESRRAFPNLRVFGRLSSGSDAAHARHEVEAFASRLPERYPSTYAGAGYTVEARALRVVLTENARPMLFALLATVVLVLLIACANVANLMVARIMRRQRELAVRAAMGAGRGRLLRQLLTESTLLSVAGGGLGLLFAMLGLDILIDFTARFTARAPEIAIDGWVLSFTLVVSVITGIAAGVLPGIRSHTDVLHAVRDGAGAQSTTGRGTLRVRSVLIAGQVALSFMLLIGAGLMVSSFVKLTQVDSGFGNENVLTAQVFPNWTEYRNGTERAGLFTDLLNALEGAPGVVSAAVANTVPFAQGGSVGFVFHAEERPPGLGDSVSKSSKAAPDGSLERGWPLTLAPFGVSTHYFDTLGIPLVEGRGLSAAELETRAPVTLLSNSARRLFWGDASPIGARIAIPDPDSDDWVWHTIVGVVGDARHFGLEIDAPPALYASYRSFGGAGQLLVRTAVDAQAMSAFIQETINKIAPAQSVENFQTYATLRSASIATPKLTATLMALFAGLAMLITVAGLAGVVGFSVSQRTHEIGIRMALGAQRASVVRMVIQQGLTMVFVGLAAGIVGALWFSNLVAGFLFETEPTDPWTFVTVAVVLVAAAVVACLIPARRVTSIDPVLALRVD